MTSTSKPPEFPSLTYRVNGFSPPWRRYPSFLYEGYRVKDGIATSLDGTRSCKVPDFDKHANLDSIIMTVLLVGPFALIILSRLL